jgi:hypothetical protein
MGKGGKGMACRREWFREERMTHERLEICFGDGRLGLLLVKPLILCRAQKTKQADLVSFDNSFNIQTARAEQLTQDESILQVNLK